ncbi:coproporphyrinogen III oxidase, partial [Candidatus Cerribacteria bacterium 'Amazon FNV 2010 28 9']
MNIDPKVLRKYNVPVPRYTSYPTVPFWKEQIDTDRWEEVFSEEFLKDNVQNGISVYMHLPFCESLCTYCGCNKKITTNHNVEGEYIEAVLGEWKLYRQLMCQPPIIREIHLGGGTPTFFSPANLEFLINSIANRAVVHPRHEFSIEGHPNNTTMDHLRTLYGLGFRRISYGV